MRILIASGDGIIGSALASKLRSQNHEVICTTRIGDTQSPYYLDVRERRWQHTGSRFDRVIYTIVNDAPSSIMDVFSVNVIGSFEWLSKVAADGCTDTAQIAVLTSQFGSITELSNQQAPWYRMSKAALNMGVALLHQQHPNKRWLCVHPGLVETPATNKLQYTHAKLTAEQSAEYICKLLDRNPSFGFYDAPSGRTIGW